eukprot:2090783-Rhodomonas_salina.2
MLGQDHTSNALAMGCAVRILVDVLQRTCWVRMQSADDRPGPDTAWRIRGASHKCMESMLVIARPVPNKARANTWGNE